MADLNETVPVQSVGWNSAARLVVAPFVRDDRTGALYVHKDYICELGDWVADDRIPPIKRTEQFGDVESWVEYVHVFGRPMTNREGAFRDTVLLTWSERGLRAVLDYHGSLDDPGRCQWVAEHCFNASLQWRAWAGLANNHPRGQKATIEALEDLAEDIVAPEPGGLIALLRALRANASATADTELQPDGTTRIAFTKTTSVKNSAADVSLPSELTIAIPVLKGHTATGDDGKRVPVLYRMPVRVRVSVDDAAHLQFRFSMPTAERVLEAVYADRVEASKALLGDGYTLLRAAG